MALKKALLKHCFAFIEGRELFIHKTIEELNESLLSETKSSAGDKHETGRAMVQLELEKVGTQLVEIQKIKSILSKIDVEKTAEAIGLGNVVYTSQHNYFIAISAGQLHVENDAFYAIASDTPIGKLLIGRQIGDSIAFRDQNFSITNVL